MTPRHPLSQRVRRVDAAGRLRPRDERAIDRLLERAEARLLRKYGASPRANPFRSAAEREETAA